MDSIITSLRNYETGEFLWLKRDGHRFQVVYSGKEARLTSRTFAALENATEIYLNIAQSIILRKYSDSDRRRYLMTGKMK